MYTIRRNGCIVDVGINRKQALMWLENVRCVALSAGIGVTVKGVGNDLTLTTANGFVYQATTGG